MCKYAGQVTCFALTGIVSQQVHHPSIIYDSANKVNPEKVLDGFWSSIRPEIMKLKMKDARNTDALILVLRGQ